MSATCITKGFAGPLGVRLGGVLILVAMSLAAGTGMAWEGPERRADRIVASIDIDSDGIVIRTEAGRSDDYGDVDIVLDGNAINWVSGGDLCRLRHAGIFDIRECDDDDIVRFGKDIHIRQGKKIRGSVVAIGGSVFVEGRVSGDVVAIGGSVTLTSGARVKGDAVVVGGDLELRDGSSVRGDAVAVGGNIEDEEGAYIGGDVVSMEFCLW